MNQKTASILFIDSVHEILKIDLTSAGFHCIIDEKGSPFELSQAHPNIIGIVLRSRWKITAEIMDLFPNLKWIARSGSGLENIDTTYAQQKGITIISSPEGNADAVGEYVVGMILTMLRKFIPANVSVKKSEWLRETFRGVELKYNTVGIIGLGNMGKSVAQKLQGFGCKIIAHDKYLPKSPMAQVELVDIQEIFNQSDIVTLHLPLTEETLQYANEPFFNSFKKPIFFINTARGKHCVIEHLLNAIDQGKVSGAAIDVLEFESTQLIVENENSAHYHRLLAHPKVILTPHIAGWTSASYFKLSKVLSDKILTI